MQLLPRKIALVYPFLLASIASTGAEYWTSLFDGKTLNGWTQAAFCNGKAEFSVKDGCIVGTTKTKTPNSFLLADKNYGNFIFEFEFKVPAGMNSGVQIRSVCDPATMKGRVNGYQVEIDPSARGWTAGIYGEAWRGWLYNLKNIEKERGKKAADAAKNAFKKDAWNHVRVEAINDSIRTWLNQVPVADLQDDPEKSRKSGVIALQVHATGNPEPKQILWRNLRIQDLGTSGTTRQVLGDIRDTTGKSAPAQAEVLLGKTTGLKAWRSANRSGGPAPWKLQDGVMTVVPGKGSIATQKDYRDFRLHLEFNVPAKEKHSQDDGNSGVYIQRRYELQILNSWKQKNAFNECGALYRQKQPLKNASRPAGEWQSYDIVFRSPRFSGEKKVENARISVVHNGVLIHDNAELQTKTGAGQKEGPTPGPILLQDHANPVKFRNIWIEELQTITKSANAEEEALTALPSYKFGDNRAPLIALEKIITKADAPKRATLAGKIGGILTSKETTVDAKRFCCRLLLRLGEPQSIPALLAQLHDPKVADYAIQALTPMQGTEINPALRKALGYNLPIEIQTALMNSLASRGDRDAIPHLSIFLENKNEKLVGATLLALGKLGGEDALDKIRQTKVSPQNSEAKADALLRCAAKAIEEKEQALAEKLLLDLTAKNFPLNIRFGAYELLCELRGDKAVPVIIGLLGDENPELQKLAAFLIPKLAGGKGTTEQLVAALPSLSTNAQTILLTGLSARGERVSNPGIIALLKNKDKALRLATIETLAKIGSADATAPLLELTKEDASYTAPVVHTLASINDPKIEPILTGILGNASGERQMIAMEVLEKRHCLAALPVFYSQLEQTKDRAFAKALWKSVKHLATEKDAKVLIQILAKVSTASILREATKTVSSVIGNLTDAEARAALLLDTLETAKEPGRSALIELLGKFPAENSLAMLLKTLDGDDEKLQRIAVKALASWTNPAPAPSLLAFAGKTRKLPLHVLAIRGYVSLVEANEMPEAEYKEKLELAYAVCRRDEEKKLIREAENKLRITKLKVKSKKKLVVVPKGVVKDQLVYIDRTYVFDEIPADLQRATLIKTAMNDRVGRGPAYLTFEISRTATVIVCYDGRAKGRPAWLKDWKQLKGQISSTDRACKMNLFAKEFPAGEVKLNGNDTMPGVGANYYIAVSTKKLIED